MRNGTILILYIIRNHDLHTISFQITRFVSLTDRLLQAKEAGIRDLKQTDAAVNKQVSIQKDSRPSESNRLLTSFTL